MEQQTFGYWLKLKRKALDLTRDDLAKQIGYSAATIRKIEDEERLPSAQVVERLAEVFQISQNERTNFLRFARSEGKSAPVETKAEVPWQISAKLPRSNVPATVTSLVGREQEVADVHDYLLKEDIRLVTLIGPPGIGKTRLSIEAARSVLPDFSEGVFFVALALLDDPKSIASAIVQALGYIESSGIAPEDQLKSSIGQKQMLIVMDNCEHLIEAAASVASRLLSACPHLKMLATSRESLRIPGEWLYLVQAFDIPIESDSIDLDNAAGFPALTLFVERARAVRPDFKLTADNIHTIAAICAHLDGLPLVIELIAARIRLMSPQTLLERMSSHFVLTADGMRAPSERQKTLWNAIDWSYKLLSEQEQKLFAYLSVFTGGFTLRDVETILGHTMTEKSVPEVIGLILDKSLMQLAVNQGAEDRYQMLVTIQEYAHERLQQRGEETKVRNWHLAYFLELAKRANPELYGHNQIEWLDRLSATRDNLRAAWTWAIETGQTQSALDLARNLDQFWFVRGEHTEGRQWLGRVLEMPDAASYPGAQAEILTQLAHHIFIQVGKQQQLPFIEQALALARSRNDKHNIARALTMLGLYLVDEKDYAAARSAFEESQALYQEAQDEWGYAHAVMCLAYSMTEQDTLERALPLYQQALSIFRKLGDRFLMCPTLRGIAIVHILRKHPASAVPALREALLLAQQLDSKLEMAGTFSWWGDVERGSGNFRRAVILYMAAKNLFDLLGGWPARFSFDLEKDLAPCREAMGELAFMEAIEQGRAITLEQAVTYALEDEE